MIEGVRVRVGEGGPARKLLSRAERALVGRTLASVHGLTGARLRAKIMLSRPNGGRPIIFSSALILHLEGGLGRLGSPGAALRMNEPIGDRLRGRSVDVPPPHLSRRDGDGQRISHAQRRRVV